MSLPLLSTKFYVRLAGLIDFELLMVIYSLISIPLSVALYLTLRNTNPAFMLLYLALSITGAIAFTAARPALEMLYLSQGSPSYLSCSCSSGTS